MPLHRKHCKEGATVVTQFWIHQDFLKCYVISIIIYKNPKKLLRKSLKMQKYIFLESTASFHQNRIYRVNTGQTMSTRVKNEFRAVSGQNCYFWPKPSSPGQYGSNHVDQGKKWVSGRFGSKPLFLAKPSSPGQYGSNHVDQGKKWVLGHFGSKPSFSVKTESTESIRVKPCRPG